MAKERKKSEADDLEGLALESIASPGEKAAPKLADSSAVASAVCGTASRADVNSIEFTRDAKGSPRWTIKLYGERGDDMNALLSELAEIDGKLRAKFGG